MRVKRILLDFIKRYKWRYLAGIVFLFITSFITSLIPKIIGLITDGLNDKIPVSIINRYVLFLIAAAFGEFGFRFTWRYFLVGNCRYLECYLREKLFKHLQVLPASFYDNSKTGDLIAYAINDIQAIRRTFGFGFTAILNGVVINTVSIVIMVRTINPILTAMALAPAPLVVFVIYKLRKKIRERFTAVQKAFAEISEKVQENITGIRIIKSFAQEEEEVGEFEKYSQARVDTQMKLTRISAALRPVTQLFFGLSLTFFIMYGSGLVTRGIISLGDYVAFNSYIMVIMGPILNIGRVIEVWQRGIASMGRLDKIFCEKGEKNIEEQAGKEEEQAGKEKQAGKERQAVNNELAGKEKYHCGKQNMLDGDIVIKDLDFTYPGSGNKALNGINLVVKAGETLGILGKTGSGKTTFVNLLLRMYDVGDGHIFIGGKDINHIPLDVLRENIGYVPQDNFLFSTTIRNNIEFFRQVYEEDEIEKAARIAEIYEDILSFPEGFETVVGERGVTLSGGQKQRVSIARALIKNPDIIILDDSLSAVDTKTEEEILKNLKKVLKNRTGIIISHRVSSVRYADRIIFLDEGRIIESGTHEELMKTKGVYYSLYISQMEQDNKELHHA
jgi:ATP-binding cassette subfamily B multidrug efflux pump